MIKLFREFVEKMEINCGRVSPDGIFYCTEELRGHTGEHRAGAVNQETGKIDIVARWANDKTR